MYKAALIASVAVAHEFRPYGTEQDDVWANTDFPAFTTPLTFEQVTGQANFTLLTD